MTVLGWNVFFVALNALQLTRILRERAGAERIAPCDRSQVLADALQQRPSVAATVAVLEACRQILE